MEEFKSNNRDLVEKFRAEYMAKQAKKTRFSLILLLAGIGIFVAGIVIMIRGFSSLFDDPFGGIGGWMAGIFMLMGGLPMTFVGIASLSMAKRDTLVPYIKEKLRQEELKNPDKLMEAVGGRENQKSCPYCGFANNAPDKVCSHCGASI
jgi:UPF0716 family protein affecting phage T7 exclusion